MSSEYFHPDLGIIGAADQFHLDGVNYSGLRFLSEEQIEALGFVLVTYASRPSDQFYAGITEDRSKPHVTYSATPRPVTEVQGSLIQEAKERARNLIVSSGHDDYAARKVSTGQEMPAAVVKYAEDVRQASRDYEAAVLDGKTIDDLAKLPAPDWPVAP